MVDSLSAEILCIVGLKPVVDVGTLKYFVCYFCLFYIFIRLMDIWMEDVVRSQTSLITLNKLLC